MDWQLMHPHPEGTTSRQSDALRLSERGAYEQEAAAMHTSAILPEQSLSFVKIFLNAAIASVLYSRELFKHDSSVFSQRCVADLLDPSGPVTYKDFLVLNTQAGLVKSQIFKILVKGESQRADKILTLLVRIRSPA